MNELFKIIPVCRCCMSNNCYKDLNNEYYCGSRVENYSNMLMNIFSINVSNSLCLYDLKPPSTCVMYVLMLRL